MSFVSGVVVYIMIWWVVLFCVLPFGVAREHEGLDDTHMAPGASHAPKVGKKMLVTTLISFVVWGIVYVVIDMEIINFREMAKE